MPDGTQLEFLHNFDPLANYESFEFFDLFWEVSV